MSAPSSGSRKIRPPQLQLPLDPSPRPAPFEPYVISSVLRRHRSRATVEAKVRYCLNFFPELQGQVFGIGLTHQALGLASLEEFAIWLNPVKLSLHTISHEITHLLQARRLVPGGERACDLHALARHPSLNDSRPNYLDLPDEPFDERSRVRRGWPGILYETARRAVVERAGGRRAYLRWFEAEISALAAALPVEGSARGAGAAQPASPSGPSRRSR